MSAIKWREATLLEAAKFIQAKAIEGISILDMPNDYIRFTDGSKLSCESVDELGYDRYHGELVPYVHRNPPVFQLFESKDGE
jgi:uncharacterized protein YdaL